MAFVVKKEIPINSNDAYRKEASDARSEQDRYSFAQLDGLIAGVLMLGAALARAPYLSLLPIFNDCVLQPVYAMSIRPGGYMPLVGNDPYAGPVFLYILAVSLKIFASPVTPLVVVLLMGALTVGLTYLLGRALGLGRPWAVLAGLLMAANPHHILVNSHIAGASYIVPLFSTGFLLALVLAVKRESGPWLIAASVLLGLALQANPAAALLLPGVAVWFLAQSTGRLPLSNTKRWGAAGRWLRTSAIGLRTRWPYLAIIALIVVYAPVIAYNVHSGLEGVKEAQIRDYIWQPNPSMPSYLHNLGRLALQLGRQVSGVLEGDESLRDLTGLPILYCIWAIAGLAYAARRGLSLPALAAGSQVLITPWLSDYYGMTIETRFTNQLSPLIFVAMSALAAGVWGWVRAGLSHSSASSKASRQDAKNAKLSENLFASWRLGVRHPIQATGALLAVYALCLTLSLWPLVLLFHYYAQETARGATNEPFFAFYDDFMKQWHGEKIFLSETLGRFNPTEFFLATHRVPYSLMPIDRMMEWLALGQESGPVVLILDKDDVARVQTQTELIAWDTPAMQTVNKMGYGAYTIADARQVRKPQFVFTDADLASTVHPVQIVLAEQLAVIGYEPKSDTIAPGDPFVVNLYWKAIGAILESYTGFLHLVGPDGKLVAQDDHELGRGFYRTMYWQPDEVIRERYQVTLPKNSPPGDYVFRVGAYGFPSLKSLAIRSASTPVQDNTATLFTLHVGQ